MIVRPARPKDLSAIAQILTECGIAAKQDMSEFSGITLVAERGGEIVGFAQAIPARPIAYFALLAVHPAHQKGRAGYKLVEGVELLLRASGCVEWSAFVQEGDPSWQRTMEKWGADVAGHAGHLMRKGLA